MAKNKENTESGRHTSAQLNQKFLSPQEVHNLINSIRDMRDKLCVWILYETGCQLFELVNIKISDVNEKEIKINNPDTNEERITKISSLLAKKISLYIQGNGLTKNSYLFSTQKSERISVKRTREIIQNCSAKLGYGKLNPQLFRYYHVAHAYLSGVFAENIAYQLGIKRYRVFQIIEESNVVYKENRYEHFLIKMENIQ